jgi:hypothetical protein
MVREIKEEMEEKYLDDLKQKLKFKMRVFFFFILVKEFKEKRELEKIKKHYLPKLYEKCSMA